MSRGKEEYNVGDADIIYLPIYDRKSKKENPGHGEKELGSRLSEKSEDEKQMAKKKPDRRWIYERGKRALSAPTGLTIIMSRGSGTVVEESYRTTGRMSRERRKMLSKIKNSRTMKT